ncbi:hypothetical protein P167DRAFT_548212 [Morchella conica CCBAS932]|uniref:C2H2-type domain-containing protein n=1 Tax=Morchella conica CCBAS932 TaxID=1392247 RepID=A0A3N4KU67_9PEZI|nr:hypothetical protein P167DRAFT_548212 [Morchella conica CCBAS932]
MPPKPTWERMNHDDSDDSAIYSDSEIVIPGSSASATTLSSTFTSPHQCLGCNLGFANQADLRAHKKANSETHAYCNPCDRDFDTPLELKMHVIKSPRHIVCLDCFREFGSKGGLEGHRKQMHRVAQRIKCPGCNAYFNNASGIAQHIESDFCTRGLGAAALTQRIVASHDPSSAAAAAAEPGAPKPATTSTHVWREGIAGEGAAVQETDMGPSVLDYTDGVGPEGKEFTLKDMGRYWRADEGFFVCNVGKCRKRFTKAGQMLQHAKSTAHARKVFRCPTCCDRFKSSSALLQHIESASCAIGKSEQATAATNKLTGGLLF